MFAELLSPDHRIFHFINHELANPVFDVIMPILRNRWTWLPVYILLGVYTVYTYKEEAWKYIALIVLAFAVSDLLTYHLLKPWFHRSRPCFDVTMQVRLVLGHCGGKWSFPSSHATNHMAISMAIILSGLFRKKWMNGIIFIWPLIVGLAQIYVGVHYPADIMAGWVWGAFLGWLLFMLSRQIFKKNKGG